MWVEGAWSGGRPRSFGGPQSGKTAMFDRDVWNQLDSQRAIGMAHEIQLQGSNKKTIVYHIDKKIDLIIGAK